MADRYSIGLGWRKPPGTSGPYTWLTGPSAAVAMGINHVERGGNTPMNSFLGMTARFQRSTAVMRGKITQEGTVLPQLISSPMNQGKVYLMSSFFFFLMSSFYLTPCNLMPFCNKEIAKWRLDFALLEQCATIQIHSLWVRWENILYTRMAFIINFSMPDSAQS